MSGCKRHMNLIFGNILAQAKENTKSRLHSLIMPSGRTKHVGLIIFCDFLLTDELLALIIIELLGDRFDPNTEIITPFRVGVCSNCSFETTPAVKI